MKPKVEELDAPEERADAVRQLLSAEELLALAESYNWDDGMAVPAAVINHPCCDLGLALRLFELADGIAWLTEKEDWDSQEAWAAFCQELSGRVQGGVYEAGSVSYESSFSAVQRYKALKAGVPSIFFQSICGDHPSLS